MPRLKELERGFVLDSVCLSHLANDETNRTFPSLNIGKIIQYITLAVVRTYHELQVFHSTRPNLIGIAGATLNGEDYPSLSVKTVIIRYFMSTHVYVFGPCCRVKRSKAQCRVEWWTDSVPVVRPWHTSMIRRRKEQVY